VHYNGINPRVRISQSEVTMTQRRRPVHWLWSVLLALLLAGILVAGAGAHASMIKSEPPNFALRSPDLAQVVARFDLPLQPEASTITVFDASGLQVDAGDGGVDPADSTRQILRTGLPAPLAPGTYTVRWHVMSDEGLHTGHVTEGHFTFWISDQMGLRQPAWAFAVLGLLGALASLGIWIWYART